MQEPAHKANWDISQIDEYIYLGADMCCGRGHYDYLVKGMGIKIDIDVQRERLETPSNLLDTFLWLPVKDHTSPNPQQLEAGVATISASVSHKQKVFVHCRLGHGRSPTLVAAYYISQSMSVTKAISKIKQSRPEIHPNKTQIKALEQFEKNLTK